MTLKIALTTSLFLLLSLPVCAQTDNSETTESRLEMPNAFSPNGDGINDIYQAKSNYENIVSFRATIFNRKGQRLYEWSEIAGGWDGSSGGHPAKDGVYFVRVVAKGGDDRDYDIKKAVTLLRQFNESTEMR